MTQRDDFVPKTPPPVGLVVGRDEAQVRALVRHALGEVGEPYTKHRDCSGFVAWCYRQIGIAIPEGSVAQFSAGRGGVLDFQPGDLLFWDTYGPAPGHVALYIGDGKVVHALNEERGIIISNKDAPMGGPFMGACRILSSDSPIVEKPAPVEESPKGKAPGRNKRHRRHLRREGKL